jgi:lipopolysaccharide transport system ATP-binding protein
MSYAISVEHVSKAYRLGMIGGATLRDDVSRWWAKVRGRPDPLSKIGEHFRDRLIGDQFWALEDVSFDVKHGELLGIIGRNGAGKSTLLKILSQITAPTAGKVTYRGRIASLLEVGTGFHPELTGRENVYLNGAILGMTKPEIRRKFDEIVAFSECEAFIDTPVKRYSSGMHVRLAFAVAAHQEPEILIVDEVLAVGDAQFQRKCLGKMQQVTREGRTVLFVSHTMASISRLCDRAILLRDGRILRDGAVHEVVGAYLDSDLGTTASREWPDVTTAPGDDIVKLRAVRVRGEEGRVENAVDIRHAVGIEVEYDVMAPGLVLVPNVHVYNAESVCVFIAHDCDPEWRRRPRPTGHYSSTCWIPGNFLAEGTFVVGAAVSTHVPAFVHAWEVHAVAFEVIDSTDGDSARGDYSGPMPGIVRPILRWSTIYEPAVEALSLAEVAE